MSTKESFLSRPSIRKLPKAEQARRWQQSMSSGSATRRRGGGRGPASRSGSSVSLSSAEAGYLASLVDPEGSPGYGIPDGKVATSHRFQTRSNEALVFDPNGAFAAVVAPHPVAHVFQPVNLGSAVHAGIGAWATDGEELVPQEPWNRLHLQDTAPDSNVPAGTLVEIPLLHPRLEGESFGSSLLTSESGGVPCQPADTFIGSFFVRSPAGTGNHTYKVEFLLSDGTTSTVTSSASTNYSAGGLGQRLSVTAPALAVAAIAQYVDTNTDTLYFLNCTFEAVLSRAAVALETMVATPIEPLLELEAVGGQLRCVSMQAWVQYQGSSLDNGQVAMRLMTSEDDPFLDQSVFYSALASMPNAYSGVWNKGCYGIYHPVDTKDTDYKRLGDDWEWDQPFLVISGKADTANARSGRLLVVANWELQHTSQLLSNVPTEYSPAAVANVLASLRGFIDVGENDSHMAKIRNFLARAIAGAGRVSGAVDKVARIAQPVLDAIEPGLGTAFSSGAATADTLLNTLPGFRKDRRPGTAGPVATLWARAGDRYN